MCVIQWHKHTCRSRCNYESEYYGRNAVIRITQTSSENEKAKQIQSNIDPRVEQAVVMEEKESATVSGLSESRTMFEELQ